MRKNIKLFTAAIGALLLIVITLIARDRLLRILHSTFSAGTLSEVRTCGERS